VYDVPPRDAVVQMSAQLRISPPALSGELNLSGVGMNIFVGNLGPDVTEVEVADLFKPFGRVESVQLVRELFTGKLRGFGFVEMPGKQHSLAAIAGLNGKELSGRPLKVNEARPRPDRGHRR
jgi:RNA recognition motif-containing protein